MIRSEKFQRRESEYFPVRLSPASNYQRSRPKTRILEHFERKSPVASLRHTEMSPSSRDDKRIITERLTFQRQRIDHVPAGSAGDVLITTTTTRSIERLNHLSSQSKRRKDSGNRITLQDRSQSKHGSKQYNREYVGYNTQNNKRNVLTQQLDNSLERSLGKREKELRLRRRVDFKSQEDLLEKSLGRRTDSIKRRSEHDSVKKISLDKNTPVTSQTNITSASSSNGIQIDRKIEHQAGQNTYSNGQQQISKSSNLLQQSGQDETVRMKSCNKLSDVAKLNDSKEDEVQHDLRKTIERYIQLISFFLTLGQDSYMFQHLQTVENLWYYKEYSRNRDKLLRILLKTKESVLMNHTTRLDNLRILNQFIQKLTVQNKKIDEQLQKVLLKLPKNNIIHTMKSSRKDVLKILQSQMKILVNEAEDQHKAARKKYLQRCVSVTELLRSATLTKFLQDHF